MLKVISVGYNIKSDKVNNIDFNSVDSFLDGDIVVIDSNNSSWYSGKISRSYGSNNILRQNGAREIIDVFKRRKNEINNLLLNGKIVFAFLCPCTYFKIETSYNEYKTYNNYSWVPDQLHNILYDIEKGKGKSMFIDNFKSPLSNYYKAFKEDLMYLAYLSTNSEKQPYVNTEFIIRNKTQNDSRVFFKNT